MDIPGYKILDTLGKGGMATVYLAIQESFERKVAIKVMSAQLAQDPAFGERFQREARIVSQMNHPNIVTVYDVGVVDNHHYLAMQYVEGKELRYRLKSLDLASKLRVVRDVASALHYAGNKGYVHRDVKPENVMICDEDGRAILMDFGIAKASDGNHSMTQTGMAIGTPYYMSPEQAQGKPVDKRSDLYSLGVMFFQLLTGHVPYDADSGVAIGIKHVTEPVPLLPRHLQVFQSFLNKVMAKEPDQRYQSGAELIAGLEQVTPSDLSEIDEILMQEINKVQTTDPHAATVMAEATPPPPTLAQTGMGGTGNVTTADAQRVAQRISAGEAPVNPISKRGQSPWIGLGVIVLFLVLAIWFLQKPAEGPAAASSGPDSASPAIGNGAVTDEPLIDGKVIDGQVIDEQVITPEHQAREPDSEAVQTAQTPTAADTAVDTAARTEEEAPLADEAARQKAIEEEARRKEQSLAEAKAREQEKVRALAEAEAQAKAAAERAKAEQIKAEQFKAEQLRRDEINRRLQHAKSLHEQGALVSPANDNAVQAYRKVLEFDPENTPAQQALSTIESNFALGIRTLLEQQQWAPAKDQLDKARLHFPDSVAIAELDQKHQQQSVAQVPRAEQTRQQVPTPNLEPVQNPSPVDELVSVPLNQDTVGAGEAVKTFAEKSPSVALLPEVVSAGQPPRITRIVVNDEDFQQMDVVQKEAVPLGRNAYVGFLYEGFKEGQPTVLQAILYDSSRSVKIMQKAVVINGTAGSMFFKLSRQVDGFAAGGYIIDFLSGDHTMATLSFTVSHP